MDDLTLEGQTYRAWSMTGIVSSTSKRAETRVFGAGAGGHVGQYGGSVSPVYVSSAVTTKHEIWLRKADGTEESVQLTGVDFPVKEGQSITVVSAGIKDSDTGWIIGVINRAVNKHWFVTSPVSIAESTGITGGF